VNEYTVTIGVGEIDHGSISPVATNASTTKRRPSRATLEAQPSLPRRADTLMLSLVLTSS